MKTIQGNLIEMFNAGQFDVLVHGCNCQADMSGGIALQIAVQFPEAAKADYFHLAPTVGESSSALDGPSLGLIINAYTQEQPGPDATVEGIVKAFRNLKDSGILEGLRVGIPMIGAGIGGLQWDDVEAALDELQLDNVTVVEYVQ